jgi:hypothetical protein
VIGEVDMAKQMQFTDQYGNINASSYWRIVQINLGIADRNAVAILYGYKDKASRDANKSPIGQKTYSISGTAFDMMMAKHLNPTTGKNIAKQTYDDVVNITNDVPAPTPQDPNAKVNFFSGATDVIEQ